MCLEKKKKKEYNNIIEQKKSQERKHFLCLKCIRNKLKKMQQWNIAFAWELEKLGFFNDLYVFFLFDFVWNFYSQIKRHGMCWDWENGKRGKENVCSSLLFIKMKRSTCSQSRKCIHIALNPLQQWTKKKKKNFIFTFMNNK